MERDSVVDEKLKREKDVILQHVSTLFGAGFSERFQDEEITSYAVVADLVKRDSDAGIFKGLGLKYGAAVYFKNEFLKLLPTDLVNTPNSRPADRPCKPTMGELSSFDPHMKRLYLAKRKKVGIMASEHWGPGNYPKFNTPERKAELEKFTSQIESKCSVPEIGFNSNGISKHIQDFFNEQRRYKRKSSEQQAECVTPNEPKWPKMAEGETLSKQDVDDCDKSDSEHETSSTVSAKSDEESNASSSASLDSQLTTPINRSPNENNYSNSKDHSLTTSKLVVKLVFGRLLERGELVDILKTKFDIKHSSLIKLKQSKLLSILTKKLIKRKYVSLKAENDVKVHRTINFKV